MDGLSSAADPVDLAHVIRAGDRVLCGQGCAEAVALTGRLAAVRERVGPFEVFVGPVFSDSFADAPAAGLRFASYGAMGRAARLARAGVLEVWPIHYGTLAAGFADGTIRADVVLLQLAAGPEGYAAALANDYTVAAARHARCVVGEVNRRAPWCHGAELDPAIRIDAVVETDRDPVPLAPATVGEAERAIARHVAALVPDGATLQIGIGAIPDAVLSELGGHRDLGIHSGLIGDRVVALIAGGAVTNGRKAVDPGLTVSNTAFGTERLFRFIDRNPAVRLRPASHTHAPAVLAAQERMTAINAAIEVDLSGQINAELADGAPVGGVGGLVDFTRGARASRGGRAIVALRSTDRGGAISRIVPRVAAVTVARSDVDTVVTEHGVAQLAHRGPAERARALIAIAAPQHRDALARSLVEGAGA